MLRRTRVRSFRRADSTRRHRRAVVERGSDEVERVRAADIVGIIGESVTLKRAAPRSAVRVFTRKESNFPSIPSAGSTIASSAASGDVFTFL
jgi:hypothetical protein